ncbi:MAG: hypothetical protein GX230_06500 [Lentisphaerae bacterium]|jgi:hypothetical protein|nr:hypothetical protein [Lentisphaerota bacterium]
MHHTLLFGTNAKLLQQKIATVAVAPLWHYLISRWEGIAARVAEKGPFSQGSLAYLGITPMVVEAAAIWHLSGHPAARDYAISMINHLLDTYTASLKPDGQPEKLYPHSHGEVALAADLLGSALPTEVETRLLNLIPGIAIAHTNFEHALAGYSAGNNVAVARNVNAAIAALIWGEKTGYHNWQSVVDNTCDNVRQYLRTGCDPLGFSYEGSGYGAQVMEMIFLFCHLLRQARWHDDLLRSEPLLQLQPAAFQHLILPDGSYSATTSDQGTRLPMGLWWLLLAANEWHRPDYRGVWEHFSGPDHPIRPWGDYWPTWGRLTNTETRTLEHLDKTLIMTLIYFDPHAQVQPFQHSPLPTACYAPEFGITTSRTSWRNNAIFTSLLGAGRSTVSHAHAQADCGHFNIAIGGEYLAVDTGRYNNNEDQHSVILIDGVNNQRSTAGKGMGIVQTRGRLYGFQRHRTLDYCIADATEIKGARWALRNFLFIKTGTDSGYVITVDNINPDNGAKPHTYWWQMQCATTARIELTGDHTATVHGTKARIDCAFFQKPEEPTPGHPHSLSLDHDIKEWAWPYGHNQDPAELDLHARSGERISSFRRPRLLAKQTTGSCMLLAFISPHHNGEESRSVRQIPVTNGIGIEVDCGPFTDTILVAPDHKYILTDQLKAFAEFALIRRAPDGSIIDTWTDSHAPLQFFPT